MICKERKIQKLEHCMIVFLYNSLFTLTWDFYTFAYKKNAEIQIFQRDRNPYNNTFK